MNRIVDGDIVDATHIRPPWQPVHVHALLTIAARLHSKDFKLQNFGQTMALVMDFALMNQDSDYTVCGRAASETPYRRLPP